MSITIQYHSLLRRTAGRRREELSIPDGATVGDALDALAGIANAALLRLLFKADGTVVPYLVVFRNQKLVTHDRFDTRLADGDELKLFLAVSGG